MGFARAVEVARRIDGPRACGEGVWGRGVLLLEASWAHTLAPPEQMTIGAGTKSIKMQ